MKRLVITERTKFLETRQHPDWKKEVGIANLKDLTPMKWPQNNELILLRLIEGMHHLAFKYKLLETLQSINLTVETCIKFMQQLELIIKVFATIKLRGRVHHKQIRNSMQIPWWTACQVKMVAQPSIRHAPFAKEIKSRPEGVQIQKKSRNLKTSTWIEEGLKFSR